MKKFIGIFGLLILVSLFLIPFSLMGADETIPKAQLPVLTTSAGQSADINTLNVILEQHSQCHSGTGKSKIRLL